MLAVGWTWCSKRERRRRRNKPTRRRSSLHRVTLTVRWLAQYHLATCAQEPLCRAASQHNSIVVLLTGRSSITQDSRLSSAHRVEPASHKSHPMACALSSRVALTTRVVDSRRAPRTTARTAVVPQARPLPSEMDNAGGACLPSASTVAQTDTHGTRRVTTSVCAGASLYLPSPPVGCAG